MKRFYIASDYELMIDILKAEINFLKSSWQNLLGRPLVVLNLNQMYLGIILNFLLYLYMYVWIMLADFTLPLIVFFGFYFILKRCNISNILLSWFAFDIKYILVLY